MRLAHQWSLRDWQLLVIAGLSVVGWVLGWRVALPLWTQWQQVREEVDTAQQHLEDLQQLLARHSSVEEACRASPQVWSDEPESILQRVWWEELDGVARAEHLRLELIPKATHVEGRLTRLQVEVAVEATQDALAGFLEKLLTSASAIQIDRLQLVPAASSTSVRATLMLSKLVMSTT